MRYSIILPWVTVVSAIPSFHQEFLLSERDALAEPSFYTNGIRLQVRDAKGSSGLASAALHDAGRLVKDYGPDVTRAIANNINQQRQQQQQQQQQPQRRDPSWESAALHEAGHLVKEYAPDVTRAIANNMNQQRQQQQHKRDPNFFKKLEHGVESAVNTVAPMALKMLPAALAARDLAERDPRFLKTLEHDAGAVAKAVGPLALKYGPEIAGAALMARDPSFIKTAEQDASKALHTAGNLAYQYGPDVALAVLDHKSSKAGKRDLEFALYERDAEAEADFEELFARDAELDDFYNELYLRDLGYFDE